MNKRQVSSVLAAILVAFCPFAAEAKTPFKWPTIHDKPEPPKEQQSKPAPAPDADQAAKSATSAPRSESPKISDADAKRPFASDAIKHYNRGVELHQTGFLNQAIEEYKQALTSDPRIEPAWSNLGGIYAAQRSYNKALEAFEKALELKPDRPTTLNGLATVLYARGRVDEAKQKWKQALDLDPKFASAAYNIGNACEGEKKPTDAIEWYGKAVDINPKMSDACYRIACIYLKQSHLAQAEMMFERAIELQPDGDFVKDARKQLAEIKTQYDKELAGQGEVRMNILPPRDSSAPVKAAATPNRVSRTQQTAMFDTQKRMPKSSADQGDDGADLLPNPESR